MALGGSLYNSCTPVVTDVLKGTGANVAILQVLSVLLYCAKQHMLLVQALKQAARLSCVEELVRPSTFVLSGLKYAWPASGDSWLCRGTHASAFMAPLNRVVLGLVTVTPLPSTGE
jgi:hypothetical protein